MDDPVRCLVLGWPQEAIHRNVQTALCLLSISRFKTLSTQNQAYRSVHCTANEQRHQSTERIEMGVHCLLELPTTYLLTAILEQAPSSSNYCRMFWLQYIEVCHLCVNFTLDKLLPLPSLQFGWTQKPFLHQSFQLKFLSRFQLVLKTTVSHLHHCHPFCLVDLKNSQTISVSQDCAKNVQNRCSCQLCTHKILLAMTASSQQLVTRIA